MWLTSKMAQALLIDVAAALAPGDTAQESFCLAEDTLQLVRRLKASLANIGKAQNCIPFATAVRM